MIFVHGLHDYSGRYSWAAQALAEQGYAAYGFDLRGHGKSEGGRQRIDSFDDYPEDLNRFVKLVEEQEPGLPVFLFGFSLGGNIVASYAVDHRDRIKGVIMEAPGLKPPQGRAYVGIGKVVARLFPNMAAIRIDPKSFCRDPEVVAEIAKDPLISWRRTQARIGLYVLGTGEKLRKGAKAFDIPLLLLQGTSDKLVDPDGNRLFFEQSGVKDKTLKVYDGLYHDVLHEPEKQTVLADMSEWLGRHS